MSENSKAATKKSERVRTIGVIKFLRAGTSLELGLMGPVNNGEPSPPVGDTGPG